MYSTKNNLNIKTMENFTPQNPNGKIVKLSTEADCLKYFQQDNLQKINDSLPGSQKLADFLPFYIENVETSTYTIDSDVEFSGIPQIINCDTLVFDGGSITSYVQLSINATTTKLVNPSSKNNYQILMAGANGVEGANGSTGATGTTGKNGQSKSCEDAQAGSDGGNGEAGTEGTDGQNGGGTPLSNFNLGSVQLSGTSLFTVLARGGNGGNGGAGGTGGTGGKGGNGGNATSTGCTCYNNGGDGGTGGTGGTGGKGGNAGNGSSVNQAMTVTVNTKADKANISSNVIPGSAGQHGAGGTGGNGGNGGSGGTGTKHGHDGSKGSTGAKGATGGNGNGGSNGSMPVINVISNS